MEAQKEGQLPFLDILVKRDSNNLMSAMFRKRTHTDRYLHYNLHHHGHNIDRCKIMPKTQSTCLEHRAHALDTELHHLQQTFKINDKWLSSSVST